MRSIFYVSLFVAIIIIPTIRCCSLTGSLCGCSAVVLSDRRYPSFRNFDSTISINLIRMKSYMDSLFDPTCVPVGVTINQLINFFPNRKMPRFVSVLRNCGGLCKSKPYISVAFFYPVLHRSPCFPDIYFAALTWNLYDRAKHLTSKPSANSEEKKHHRYLFRTDILLHLCESSQRQQNQQPTKNLRRNLNLLRFYPT